MTSEQAIHLIETYMDIQGLAARKGLPITQALDMALDLLRTQADKELTPDHKQYMKTNKE